MPLYEYFCPECKEKFELLRSVAQAAETASCPHCHHEAKRLLSTFTFSGGGEEISSAGSSCPTCSATTCTPCGH